MDCLGLICIADDVLIHCRTAEEHDSNLKAFLARCCNVGIKHNRNKLVIKVPSITFMGHMNQFHQLVKKGSPWNWSMVQEKVFTKLKEMITKAPFLTYYNPNEPLELENDACEYGLGSVLLQQRNPVAYASRRLSDAETKYAQIEKEMLSVIYGLEKFHQYTYDREVSVITDYKPLIAIVSKALSKAPRKLQNLMRAQKYNFHLRWKPGKNVPLADALERAPCNNSEENETTNCITISHIKKDHHQKVRGVTGNDTTLIKLMKTIIEGWPEDKEHLDHCLISYFNYRDELTAHEGLIYRAYCVVIPDSMRQEMKQKIHIRHLGINSCLRRARDVMYWPGMSAEICQYIENCGTCAAQGDRQPEESPIMIEMPRRSWVKTAVNLFSYWGHHYSIYVDYHRNFFEVDKLSDINSDAVIAKLSAHFATYGASFELVSDNGPQSSSLAFQKCMEQWNIKHITSSPYHPKGNGAAEAAVKTIKRLLNKCQASGENPFMALLNLRNVPKEHLDTSPAQRSQGRRTNSILPTSDAKLKPGYTDPVHEAKLKKAKRLTSTKKTERSLRPLRAGDVRIQPNDKRDKVWKEATVAEALPNGSYTVVDNNGREHRRNRRHLHARPKSTHDETPGH